MVPNWHATSRLKVLEKTSSIYNYVVDRFVSLKIWKLKIKNFEDIMEVYQFEDVFGSFSGTQNCTKLQDFITMPWPRHKCKQCRKWVSCNITWNAFFADAFMRQIFCFLSGILWFFSPNQGNHGKAQVAELSWLSSFQERNVRYCWSLPQWRVGEMGYPELTFAFFFGDFGSPKNPCYDVIREPANMAGETKLCPHVLIQDLLEKLHLFKLYGSTTSR